MKLALIRRQFASVGGAELYLQRLLGARVQAGHDIHLYTERWEGAAAGVTVHEVPVQAGRAKVPEADDGAAADHGAEQHSMQHGLFHCGQGGLKEARTHAQQLGGRAVEDRNYGRSGPARGI